MMLARQEAKRENVFCHVAWLILLLGGEERMYSIMLPGLSCQQQDMKRRERMCSLTLASLACSQQGGSKNRARNGQLSLVCCPGEVTRSEWYQSFSLSEIYEFELQWPKQFLHKIIIRNSFRYKCLTARVTLFKSTHQCMWPFFFLLLDYWCTPVRKLRNFIDCTIAFNCSS